MDNTLEVAIGDQIDGSHFPAACAAGDAGCFHFHSIVLGARTDLRGFALSFVFDQNHNGISLHGSSKQE